MIGLKGFELKEKTRIGSNFVSYRGIRLSDSLPVIVKTVTQSSLGEPDLNAQIRDFEIGKGFDHEHILQYIGFTQNTEGYAIILEGFKSQNLKDYLDASFVDTSTALEISLQMVKAVGAIHDQEIFHGEICLENILIHPTTQQVKFADFSKAVHLDKAPTYKVKLETGDCFLPYFSPEQSGRIKQGVDLRSDLYSLGICLYYLLTNHYPFVEPDPSSYLHAHIAKIPPSPNHFHDSIPEVLSDLVLKLLSKDVSGRYQSARGLYKDLVRCQSEWEAKGEISRFPLGTEDYGQQLTLLSQHFGRDKELQSIRHLLSADPGYNKQLVVIAGGKGLGKTALLDELKRFDVSGRSWIIDGSFEPGPVPYTGFQSALRKAVKSILSYPDALLELWKKRFEEALGPDLHYMFNLIPEFRRIMGAQANFPSLSHVEERSRFTRAFTGFLKTLTSDNRRPILLLDNLHLADQASLNLLEAIGADLSVKNLIIVASYSSDSFDQKEVFKKVQERLTLAWTDFEIIKIRPLDERGVEKLIFEGLGGAQNLPAALPGILMEKTAGNPRVIKKLLKDGLQRGFIRLKKTSDRDVEWFFDLKGLKLQQIADIALDEKLAALERLNQATMEVLEAAACIGTQFDQELLKQLTDVSEEEVLFQLESALKTGVINLEETTESSPSLRYRFVHERVYEQLYNNVTSGKRDHNHYRIAKLQLANLGKDPLSAEVYIAVNHLNKGADRLFSSQEKLELLDWNLNAGNLAMQSNAYDVAISFFKKGIEFSTEKGWSECYQKTLALHQGMAEALFLSSQFSDADKIVKTARQHTRNLEDKARISVVEIDTLIASNRISEALDLGISCLNQLGFKVSRNPGKLSVLFELSKTQYVIAREKTEKTLSQDPNKEPGKLLIARLVRVLLMAAFLAYPKLFAVLILKFTRLSIKLGLSDELNIFAVYGFLLVAIRKDYDAGYSFGELGIQLLERFPDCKNRASVVYIFNLMVKPWKDSFNDCLSGIYQAHHLALEVGQKEIAANSLATYDLFKLYTGAYLPDLEKEMVEHNKFLKLYGHLAPLTIQRYHWQLAKNLLGRSEDPCSLKSRSIDGSSSASTDLGKTDFNTLLHYYTDKIFVCFLFGSYHEASQYWAAARRDLKETPETVAHVLITFFGSLSVLKLHPFGEDNNRNRSVRLVLDGLRKLKQLAEITPSNFAPFALLLEAEVERVKGNRDPLPTYQLAIQAAERYGFIHLQAIFNQLFAEYWILRGEMRIAGLFMVEAHTCFSLWGAVAKVRQIEQDYPQMIGLLQQGWLHRDQDRLDSTIKRFDPDIHSVMEAIRAITGEAIPAKLVSRILSIIIQNSGAQNGYIIHKNKQTFVVESSNEAEGGRVETEPDQPDVPGEKFCHAIANYVLRSGEDVILDSAVEQGAFKSDPYVREVKAKSVLCIPFHYREREFGVLYLENNLVEGLFSTERTTFIRALLAQAAVSMENAQLYEESVLARKRLQKSEEKYRTLVENTAAMVLHISLDGVILFINSAGASHFKSDPIHLIGRSLYSMSVSYDQLFRERVDEIISTRKAMVTEDLIKLVDGEVWFFSSLYPVIDDQGEIIAVQITSQNISEHKLAVEELSRLSTILETTSDFVGIYAPDGSAQYINLAGKEMVGLDDDVNLVNIGMEDFHPREAMKIIRTQGIPGAIDTGRWSGETTLQHLNGEQMPVSQVIMSHKSENGDLQFLSTIIRDISRQKETELELKEYKAKLEQLVEERTLELKSIKGQLADESHKAGMAEIAAGTLHNVGNLLNSIKTSANSIGAILEHSSLTGFVRANALLSENMDDLQAFFSKGAKGATLMQYYLKLDKVLSEEQVNIKTDLQRLNEKIDIVSDIIVAQQTYAGLDSHMEEYSLVTLVEDALTLEAGLIDRYNISVVKQYDNVPMVRIQKTKMIHILINLIKNARDAMLDLPFEMRKLTFSTSADSEGVILKVQDSGLGIEKEEMDLIFTHGYTTKEEGHGFGLHSSINFVREMGGQMWVESEGKGKGASFILKFKRDKGKQAR